MSTIVRIPKGMKSKLECSENYRPIAISNLLGKVFDKIIISQQHDFLFSSSYQFGFKPHSSTMLIGRNVSPFVIRFLLFMYTNQSMRVKWKASLSNTFSIGNEVR